MLRRILHIAVALLPLLLAAFPAGAQTVLSGRVSDKTTGETLAGAFVSAYSGGRLLAYAMSGEDGGFEIRLPADKSADELRISLLGYAAEKVALAAQRGGPVSVGLTPKKTELNAATVRARVIEAQGDTVSYTAQAFADGTERVVSDLLKKLPGITVTERGGILYKDRPIQKFYVDGMDLMGSRYGVVTQNLSADAIASVEVYKNHQPVKALRGITYTDGSAVNIILKEDSRGRWVFTGDAALGAPEFPLFSVRGLVTNFAKTHQDLFLGKGNDIGTDIISELREQAYFGRTGVVRIEDGNLDGEFATPLSPRRARLPLPQSYWYDNRTGLLSLNHLSKFSDDLHLKFSLQAATERYRENSGRTETIRMEGMEPVVVEDASGLLEDRHYLTLQGYVENNRDAAYLADELTLTGQFRNDFSEGVGTSAFGQEYRLPSFKVKNVLDATLKTRGGKKAVTLKSETEYFLNRHRAAFRTAALSAEQLYERQGFGSRNTASYRFRAGRSSVTLAAHADLGCDKIGSSLSGLDGTGLQTDAELSVWRFTPYISLSGNRSFGRGVLNYSLPAGVRWILPGGADALLLPYLAPSLSLTLPLSQTWELRAGMDAQLSNSEPDKLFPAYVLRDYRTLAREDGLSRSNSCGADLRLSYSDDLAMFYASLSSSVRRSASDRVSSSVYYEDLTVQDYVSRARVNGSWSVQGRLKKFFGVGKFVLELNGGFSRAAVSEYLQSQDIDYLSDASHATLDLKWKPAKWMVLDLRGQYQYGVIRGQRESGMHHIEIGSSLHLVPAKDWSCAATLWGFRDYLSAGTLSVPPLLKVELTRKFRAFTLFAECDNVLDVQEYRRELPSAWRTVASWTRLRGRQFLGGIRMSF